MKKIYFSILSLVIASGVHAQKNTAAPYLNQKECNESVQYVHNKPNQVQNVEKLVIWSDDFSVPANWTMTNQSSGNTLDFSIETNPDLQSMNVTTMPASLTPFASTTASNGFLWISSDADPGNTDGNGTPIVCQATSQTIDLSAYPNVVLKFEHNYRWWQDERGVRVSGDGGTSWTDYPMTYTGSSGLTFPNGSPYPGDQNSLNPNVEYINISSVAGGSANVLVQFYYNDDDIWGWYWAVDDVEILEQPADDIRLMTAWYAGENNEGVEYGRTPLSQLDANYLLGGQLLNWGVNDQADVTLDASGAVTNSASDVNFASGDTIIIESTLPALASTGVYSILYTATSTGETGGGPDFGDNTFERGFELTNNVYSIDGIGNHPAGYETLSAIGTGSFTDAGDGLILANMYHFKTDAAFKTVHVEITSGSVAGAEIIVHVMDTAAWFAEETGNTLYDFTPYTLTSTDVANGYFEVTYTGGFVTLNSGAYVVTCELNSFTNSNDVFIVDDETVEQPWYASMIYYPVSPDNGVYSDGIAYAIRIQDLQLDVSVVENDLEGVSVYPNPSSGLITISNDNKTENTITVYDIVGNVVATTVASNSTTMDLTSAGNGIYLVKVESSNGSLVQRIVIK